ncbi:MAG TPA: homoserine kinase [Clostridia bacterium]|nr:homoserine kinase [Clostridia bacterium]
MNEVLKIRIPASTANLGPGFDTLGMALNLYNYLEVNTKTNGFKIEVFGEGKDYIPKDENNIVYKMMNTIFNRARFKPNGLSIKLENNIPIARGLGSSAAAIVGGALAANLLIPNPLSLEELLLIVTEFEGHPDNVAPALIGGLISSIYTTEKIIYKKINPPQDLNLVVAIPDYTLSTKVARNALPQNIPLQDAVFNIGYSTLLVLALQEGDYNLLGQVMKDKIHQPYRLPLVPGMNEVFKAALQAGAISVALSGSGPTLIAFSQNNSEIIGQAMQNAFLQYDISCQYKILKPDLNGAIVINNQ